MGRFNTALAERQTTTVNLAGGQAFVESPRLELATLLLTNLVQDQFYRKADEALARAVELVAADPLFAAKAAVFARHEFGMRSITHVVAGEVARHASGEPWKRAFFKRVIRRPDDVTEILAYFKHCYGKKLPKAMQRGLADAVATFSPYQLAKYRGEGRGIKMVDALNLLHPKPTADNAEAFGALVKDELRSRDTWESLLSAAGADGEAKGAAWQTLLVEGKLGYMALLKNLRNILQQAPEQIPVACAQLVDEGRIHASLVFPFRYVTAAAELAAVPGSGLILAALSEAADKALSNVPELPGRTCVLLDVSGSMKGKPFDLGAPFAVALVRQLGADLLIFSDHAEYVNLVPTDGIFAGVDALTRKFHNAGTDFNASLNALQAPYDRLIFLSDMQGWIGDAPTAELNRYVARHGVRPKVHSFDLQGYGTLQFPEEGIYCLAGFSDRVFDVMAAVEEDRSALINRIAAVQFP